MTEEQKREIARQFIQEVPEYVEFIDVHDVVVDELQVEGSDSEDIAREILDLIYQAKVEVTW